MRRMLAIAVAASLVAGATHAQQKTIAIGTGGTGGVYYPLGGGLANVLSKNLPGYQATAEVTGGSVDNLELIGSGQSEIGFTMVDAALDAFKGEDKFRAPRSRAHPDGALSEPHACGDDRRHRHREDLRPQGQTRVDRLTGSATEVLAFRVIEAAGLDKDKDMRRERLGAAESIERHQGPKIDAFFWVGGLPTAAVTDLGATPGVKIKLVDHADVVEKINAKYGALYVRDVIPAKTYPGRRRTIRIPSCGICSSRAINCRTPWRIRS